MLRKSSAASSQRPWRRRSSANRGRALRLMAGRTRASSFATLSELGFSGSPLATADEHAGVLHAARLQHRTIVPTRRQILQPLAPLCAAIVVASALAGVNDVAADRRDGWTVFDFSSECGGGGGIQSAHAWAICPCVTMANPTSASNNTATSGAPAAFAI
jgi:hypothetical protein